MSARTRLFAKPYVPPPAEAPVRSLTDLVELRTAGQDIPWPEAKPGNRGTDITHVRFGELGGRRDLSTGDGPTGGYLVSGETQPATVPEYLGAQLITARAGAQVVEAKDFVGLPLVKSDPGLEWLAEGAPYVGGQDPIFGSISRSLKMAAVSVKLTRQLAIYGSGIAERVVTRSLFGALARGLDRVIFHGTGTSGQPAGIANTSGIGSVVGTGFSVGTAAEMLGLIEAENVKSENIFWCCSPDAAQVLRQRPKVSGGERMILEDGKILDKQTLISNSIAAGTVFLGDFSQVLVTILGIELLVNPFTQAGQGVRSLILFWHGDVSVLQPQVFAVAEGVA